jgi:hypothetical protein
MARSVRRSGHEPVPTTSVPGSLCSAHPGGQSTSTPDDTPEVAGA